MLKRLLPTFVILFLPLSAYASCLEQGATVVYINGIFSTEAKAQDDLEVLQRKYNSGVENSNTKFLNGFNPSHLAGGGDLLKTWVQNRVAAGTYVEDYDLKTILLNLHDDLTTRKVLLVGHSQGTYYTNEMYEYLITHGLSKESVEVYNIATPAYFVAGGGKYLNSSGDSLLASLRTTFGFNPLPNNIKLVSSIDDALAALPGHSLSGAYLAEAPDRIVSDMSGELSDLVATARVGESGCFTPPSRDVVYKLQQIGLAIGDPAAIALRDGVVAGYNGTVAAANAAVAVGKKGYAAVDSTLRSAFGLFVPAPRTENLPGSFTVVKALYGSSLTEQEIKEYLKDQGRAMASAPSPAQKKEEKSHGMVLGAQTDTPSAASSAQPAPTKRKLKSRGGSSKSSVQENVTLPAPEQPEAEVPEETEVETEETPKETPVPEVASTTPPIAVSFPSDSFIMASQDDESSLCPSTPDPHSDGWRDCYTGQGPESIIDLRQGASLGDGTIYSVTIAKDENSPHTSRSWIASILCYTDAAHTQLCTDWIEPNGWNSHQTHLITESATTTSDNKHWTAYFTNPNNESNFDGSHPVTFNPDYYYVLTINDNGWPTSAYGSVAEPYWVLRGMPPPLPEEPETYTMATQPDDSNFCSPDWSVCFSDGASQKYINLGQGSGLGDASILSVTIAKASSTQPWIVSILCYSDAAYTVVCTDWVKPMSTNGSVAYLLDEFATSTPDDKYWTAYFVNPSNEKNFDETFPIVFRPDYYYQLRINDNGYNVAGYGSATEPYWVLTGIHD